MQTLPYVSEGRVEIRKDEFTTVNRPTMKIKRTSQQKKMAQNNRDFHYWMTKINFRV